MKAFLNMFSLICYCVAIAAIVRLILDYLVYRSLILDHFQRKRLMSDDEFNEVHEQQKKVLMLWLPPGAGSFSCAIFINIIMHRKEDLVILGRFVIKMQDIAHWHMLLFGILVGVFFFIVAKKFLVFYYKHAEKYAKNV